MIEKRKSTRKDCIGPWLLIINRSFTRRYGSYSRLMKGYRKYQRQKGIRVIEIAQVQKDLP